MQQRPRIQFISPFIDGDYYGVILSTLHREAKRRNIDLAVIQSLVNFPHAFPFQHPMGLDEADGWLLMTNPNSPLPLTPDLLRAIEASGRPVVTIGYREDALPSSHAVLADNRRAAREAVHHLIRDHGHRRIAYVGSAEHPDLLERFEGYKEALEANGIEYDDSLAYFMSDAVQPAGLAAGASLLESKAPCTAVFAATDLIASGLMEKFHQAGKRIPEDIAVIGFDDHPSAATLSPPLTTFRQSFADYAIAGLDRLERLIQEPHYPDRTAYIPTELVTRSSCGCSCSAVDETAAAAMQRSVLELVRLQAMIIQRQYQLAGIWNAVVRNDLFNFEQMFGAYYPWGCLALWEDQDCRRLVVRQAYSRNGAPVPESGTVIPIEAFPPSSWLAAASPDEYVHVHAIRNDNKDWGFVVVVRPVDKFIQIPAADVSQTAFSITLAALERDDLIRQVRHLAYHDGLTGLANRQMFQSAIQQCIEQSSASGTKFGILLVDLDRFKQVNDTWGHQAGDELLREVAAILRDIAQDAGVESSRQGNIAARLGGDEFIVLLGDIRGEADLLHAIDRINRRFDQPFILAGQPVQSTCSIGYAVYPDDGTDIDELTRCADLKLYDQKRKDQ